MVMGVTNLSNLSLDESTDVSNDLARGLRKPGFLIFTNKMNLKDTAFLNQKQRVTLTF